MKTKRKEAITIKNYNMEEVNITGFCTFCKNNIPLMLTVTFTLFFTYGIKLFWYSFGIDTSLFMQDKQGNLMWLLEIGRFGLFLLSKFLHIEEFNPFTAFFTAFCLIWVFTVSWSYIIAVFSRDTVGNHKLIPFALVFMTVPVWAMQFYHLHQAWENALIISLCPYIIYLLYKGILDGEKRKIICAAILLVLIISVYQAIITLFCCGVFICFLLLCQHSDYEPRIYRNLCLKLILTLLVSLGIYFFIDRIIINVVLGIGRSEYLDNMSRWGQRSVRENLLAIFAFIYIIIGQIPVRLFDTEVFIYSKVYGNVLLFPATVLFLINAALIMRKTISSGRRLLYMLAATGIPLCIIILALVGGHPTPARSLYALPLASAFMLFFLIKTYRKKAAAVVACLSLLLAGYQAQTTAQLFYSDQLRFNEDVRLAHELHTLITRAQEGDADLPVVFVGRYHTTSLFHANFLPAEMIGRSVFGSGHDVIESNRNNFIFMRNLGIIFNPPVSMNQIQQAITAAASMPSYPNPDCVRRVRNFVVVKLSAE